MFVMVTKYECVRCNVDSPNLMLFPTEQAAQIASRLRKLSAAQPAATYELDDMTPGKSGGASSAILYSIEKNHQTGDVTICPMNGNCIVLRGEDAVNDFIAHLIHCSQTE